MSLLPRIVAVNPALPNFVAYATKICMRVLTVHGKGFAKFKVQSSKLSRFAIFFLAGGLGARNEELLLNHKFIANFPIDIVSAIDESIAADLNVEHLIRRHVGHAHFRVVVFPLRIHLCPGN